MEFFQVKNLPLSICKKKTKISISLVFIKSLEYLLSFDRNGSALQEYRQNKLRECDIVIISKMPKKFTRKLKIDKKLPLHWNCLTA